MERRLAAILAADVVGYSRLMGRDEEGTLARLTAFRKELMEPCIARHHGRMVKLMGDGALVEFASVIDAVNCAVETQGAIAERNAARTEGERIHFRVGINVGDIIVEDDDIYGDGVNIAARLEGLARPGGICISGKVYDEVHSKLDLTYQSMGAQRVKNIEEPVRAYSILLDGEAAPAKGVRGRRGLGTAQLAGAAALLLVLVAGGIAFWLQPWETAVAPTLMQDLTIVLKEDRPSIAVLPFDNLSGDPEQEYFVDGMTEDLITDLSQVSGLLVIARNSVFTYKGKAVKVQEVGRELGVKYVLEGSVRRIGDRVRINAQLVSAEDGSHLWAERFDREITDVFALQDEVTQRIVSALAIKLTQGERERLSRASETNPEAYDMLLRGLEYLRRYTREDMREARAYFERAIALDPDFARGHADLALSLSNELRAGWADDPAATLERAMKHGRHALALDPTTREVYFALGSLYLRQRRHEDAMASNLTVLKLDPNYADSYAQMAWILIYAGRPEEALEFMSKAMRLNPRHAFFYRAILAQAYFHLERFEKAAEELVKVNQLNPQFLFGRQYLAATYGQMGRLEDAQWEGDEIATLQPGFTLSAERARSQYKNESDREFFIEGLRKAGLPE
ncbi:MAG: tetratricopeptide repeat protein [Kiloniellales bacterium]